MRRTKTLLLGDLLEEFFRRPYVAAKVAEGKLPETWRQVVGDRAADLTTELRLERRILYVRIQSSVLRSELFCQRDALRDALNRQAGMRLVNAVIVGAEITYIFMPETASLPVLGFNMLTVGIGEVISVGILGVALVRVIEKTPALKKIFTEW